MTPAQLPTVSVICTAYNHELYVSEALWSVLRQTYPAIELIVIDNASTDQTAIRIADVVAQNQHGQYPNIRFIQNPNNVGLNRAFNQGLRVSTGAYVMDLSADDVLLPHCLSRLVDALHPLPDTYGVAFANAQYLDARGRRGPTFYRTDAAGRARKPIPQGAVFAEILRRSFICTPTMLMRRTMLDALGGYDETLAYEDFDLWVRSARCYLYVYADAVLVQKRRLPTALSKQILRRNNVLLASTFAVCQKAAALCQTPTEREALAGRIRRCIRQCLYAEHYTLAQQFGRLLKTQTPIGLPTRALLWLSHQSPNLNDTYRLWRKLSDGWFTVWHKRY